MSTAENGGFLDQVRWDESGLVAAIARDRSSGRVLTLAWMNRDALAATVAEGRAVYWSRSRERLWRKGEESGHVQHVKEIRLDCDQDAILLEVEQAGGIACLTPHFCNGEIRNVRTWIKELAFCTIPAERVHGEKSHASDN